MSTHGRDETASGRWAHRLAVLTALLAIPLVIFGGSVTTLGAGLAVEGWLIAEGHFMVLLPIDTWIDDTHRFVEHVHRLFGTAVGLAAIGASVAAWRAARSGARSRGSAWLALAALLAVCVQGIIGGQRVELFSDSLAFLHGALAQGVLATLFASALALSPRWVATEGARRGPTPRGFAFLAVAVTAFQIVLGAAYRHALRPDDAPGAAGLLYGHLFVALIVLGVLSMFAGKLKRAAAEHDERPLLEGQARRIHVLLGIQILLGLLAWMGYRPGAIAPLEWALSVAHVLVGGLLLAQVVAAAMWSARLGHREIHARTTADVGGAA